MSKGSKQRLNKTKFNDNWEKIFGKTIKKEITRAYRHKYTESYRPEWSGPISKKRRVRFSILHTIQRAYRELLMTLKKRKRIETKESYKTKERRQQKTKWQMRLLDSYLATQSRILQVDYIAPQGLSKQSSNELESRKNKKESMTTCQKSALLKILLSER